jgi:predicted helicase
MDGYNFDNFDEIYEHTRGLTSDCKGKFFEELVYNMIMKDPHFGYNCETDHIWMYNQIPRAIITKLNLPNNDKGIDIVARINNRYISVQCKFVQNVNNTPCWKSLSTFFGLTYGVANGFDAGYLITNSYKINGVAKMSSRVSFIYGDYFDNLPTNFFRCITTDDNAVNYEIKRPYPHQTDCIAASRKHYRKNNKATIEMACGTGKTLTSYWIDKKMNNLMTIIFVPSLDLLSQFYHNWFAQSCADGTKINYILVGSDIEIKNKTDPVNGFILTTDPIEIKISLVCDKNVIICTYQSLQKVSRIKFDFGIYDEAHRLCSLTKSTDKSFANTLADDYIDIKKKLFMTATPKIVDGFELSMDNEEIYGKKIYECNYANAIDKNILVNYKLNIIAISDTVVAAHIKKNKLVIPVIDTKPFSSRKIAIALMLLDQINNANATHIVTYHSRVESANKFSNLLKILSEVLGCEEINIDSVNGSDRLITRKKIFDTFTKADRCILCSTRLLTEGVNIPIIDGVCFVNSKSSEIDIIQCIGRSLRRHPNKTEAKIYLPVFEDTTSNVKNYEKKYGNIVRILFALNKCREPIVITNNKIKTIPIRIGSVTTYNNIGESVDEINIQSWINSISVKHINKYFVVDKLPVTKKVAAVGVIDDDKVVTYGSIDDKYAVKKYGPFDIIVCKENGYINATNLCNKVGKKYHHWCENKNSKLLVKLLCGELNLPIDKIMITISGGRNILIRGTYVHPKLFVNIACWCSAKFALDLGEIINEHYGYDIE